jgi:ABC-type nitrate/sulfonate/bicarbonate transport system substrate-binding protein
MNGRSDFRLGFIALNDCAPLVVAKEKGFFDGEGLSVDLSREASWANIRDKVAMGALDGAHMLGPLPIAVNLGLSGERTPMIAPMSLNLNGSAITISTALADAMRAADPEGMASRPRSAAPLAKVVEARRAAGQPPLVFAVVFPFSVHNYQVRYWMAAAGVDPDRDVRITAVPPARMTARLAAGDIDGFCVGAPWNAQAAARMIARISALSASGLRSAQASVTPNTLSGPTRQTSAA